MKMKICLTGLLAATVLLLTACRSMQTPHVRSERIDPSTESVPAVASGYDTFGRKWEAGPATTSGEATKTMEYVTGANRSPLVRLQKRVPAEVTLGHEYSYELVVTAADFARDVIVTDTIPTGASFVRSDPPSARDAQQLMWRFPNLAKGASQTIRVWLKANQEGELAGCPTISAASQSCLASISGTPHLDLRIAAPENAVLNFAVPVAITVSNRGTITAKGVHVQYTVPEGLSQAGAEKPLAFSAGDLAPGHAKTVNLKLKAAAHARVRTHASATSSNAAPVKTEVFTAIKQPKLEMTIRGPAAEYILKDANYQVTIRNTGDATLTSLALTHEAASRTEISEAPGAASIRKGGATWKIDSFKPGEERAFNFVVTSKVPGKRAHEITATAFEGIKESVAATTDWKGVAALAIELADDADPVQVGNETVYTIRVSNQGSADHNDLKVVAMLPTHLTAVKISSGEVDGNTVRFPAVTRLAPRQSLKYQITAKGASAGDARIRVELRASDLQSPVIEEESTRVY